jgi:hypothetical protein
MASFVIPAEAQSRGQGHARVWVPGLASGLARDDRVS